jgi:hypothetical protein
MPGGSTGPLCHWETQIQRPGPPGWGFDARLTIWLCKRIIVAKSKEVKTGSNLAESFKAMAQKVGFAMYYYYYFTFIILQYM